MANIFTNLQFHPLLKNILNDGNKNELKSIQNIFESIQETTLVFSNFTL